jgi:hypothetical protein
MKRRWNRPPDPARPATLTSDRQDELLDRALEETFPASDPISPMCALSIG